LPEYLAVKAKWAIFAVLLSALILKEPITGKKALGVMMGCSGALILILTSAAHADSRVGEARLLPKGRKNGVFSE